MNSLRSIVKNKILPAVIAKKLGFQRSFCRDDLHLAKNRIDRQSIKNKELQKLTSIAGWVPYFPNQTSILLWHFFSYNYGIRKKFLIRISLVNKLIVTGQVILDLESKSVIEVNLNDYFKGLNGTSIVVEYFHEKIPKMHGGHDGHLRFWAKYRNNTGLSATTHSLPLSSGMKYLKRINYWRNFRASKTDNLYYYSPSEIEINSNKSARLFGYNLFENKGEVLSSWHVAPIEKKVGRQLSISNLIYIPNVEEIDIQLFIDSYELDTTDKEITLSLHTVEIFSLVKQAKISLDKNQKILASELFKTPVIKNMLIMIQHTSQTPQYINYCYLSNNQVCDLSHSHMVHKESFQARNALKFMHFPKQTDHIQSWIEIFLPLEQKILLKLRLILDNKNEYVSNQCLITSNIPFKKYFIENVFPEIRNESYQNGIIVLESEQYNLNGNVVTEVKGDESSNLSIDHLTGA